MHDGSIFQTRYLMITNPYQDKIRRLFGQKLIRHR